MHLDPDVFVFGCLRERLWKRVRARPLLYIYSKSERIVDHCESRVDLDVPGVGILTFLFNVNLFPVGLLC